MPAHPFTVGITVIVALIGPAALLIAVKAETLPVPVPARPIAGTLFVQLYVAPAGVLVKLAAATAPLWQTWKLAGTVTVGVGLTVMVYVAAGPLHPFAVGITVIVAVIFVVPVLIAVNVGMLPVPFAAAPIDGLLLVHV